MSKVKIAPSILSADFAWLGNEITAVAKAGADYIHIDVMDGHFVPNLTIGPVVIQSLKRLTKVPFDVHLMISPVDQYIESYVKAGADIVTVHLEATTHLDRTLQLIKSLGVKCGVSIVPSTPAWALEYVMDTVDLILVMSVNPGFGGQAFIPSQIKKLQQIRAMIDKSGRQIELEVDGGINMETARLAVAAGADVLVAGNAIFGGTTDGLKDYPQRIAQLRG